MEFRGKGFLASLVLFAAMSTSGRAVAADWWFCVAASDEARSSILTGSSFASSFDVDQLTAAFRRSLPIGEPSQWRFLCTRSDTREKSMGARLDARTFNLRRGYQVGEFDWSPDAAPSSP